MEILEAELLNSSRRCVSPPRCKYGKEKKRWNEMKFDSILEGGEGRREEARDMDTSEASYYSQRRRY